MHTFRSVERQTLRRILRYFSALAAAAIIALLLGLYHGSAKNQNSVSSSNTGQTQLTRIIDGDTIVVASGEHVRLIGMNAPEVAHPSEGKPTGQPGGPEATDHLTELLGHKPITLERDVEDRDKYGRLLRYLYVDGQNVDLQMVRDGYAQVLTIPPDVKYADQFKAAQAEARANSRGLWAGTYH